MVKRLVISIASLFIASHFYSQQSDTSWNITDNLGRKQGAWRAYYENGKIKYEGYFKDNKPVGTFKRYYDDGTLLAVQNFIDNSDFSFVKMYYQTGNLAAEGRYKGKEKDSIWKYYSYYDKTLRLEEKYQNGKRHGASIKYYPNGRPAEILMYSNDAKNGTWKQFFQNGTLKLEATYINNKREGDYKLFRPDGTPEMQGRFSNNLMVGEWIYFDEKGKEMLRIKYINGVPQNTAHFDSIQNEIFKAIDANKGKIPEPDENDFLPH